MEPITYYTRDGQEWGVLALTLDQLRTVSATLDFAMDRDNTVGAEALDIRNVVLEGIQHMEGREVDREDSITRQFRDHMRGLEIEEGEGRR